MRTRRSAITIGVPVCAVCAGHLKKNTNAAQFVGGSLIPIAVGLGIWSIVNEIWAVTVVAALLGAGVTRWLLRARAKRRETARAGHHPDLEISVTIGQTVVRTTNKRLAEHVLASHAGKVHRAR